MIIKKTLFVLTEKKKEKVKGRQNSYSPILKKSIVED
jgi:hypothetical protein